MPPERLQHSYAPVPPMHSAVQPHAEHLCILEKNTHKHTQPEMCDINEAIKQNKAKKLYINNKNKIRKANVA